METFKFYVFCSVNILVIKLSMYSNLTAVREKLLVLILNRWS